MSSSHVRKLSRSSLTASAVLAGSVAATLAGLGTANAASTAHPAAAAGPSGSRLTISNGTPAVTAIGSASGLVDFASNVTDLAWSPDGSRAAYIDGNGNLATANASGGDVVVLTSAAAGTVRSHPTWEDGGTEIVFTEKVGNGAARLMSVDADGLLLGKTSVEQPMAETSSDTTADDFADAYFSWAPNMGPGGFHASSLVYQHVNHDAQTNTDTNEIWILDRNTRGPAGSKLVDGTQPSISPDGSKVAFVDAQGQIDTVALPIPLVNNVPTPVVTTVVTSAAVHYSHVTWSPDGKTLAFEGMTPGTGGAADVPKDVETAPSAGGVAPTVVFTGAGIPAYQALNAHHVDRIAGGDRLGTAIDASQASYQTAGAANDPRTMQTRSVVLSRSDQFADALGGSALAENVHAPLLLTPTAALDANVKAEIIRVLGPADPQYPQTVFLLGGEKALSANVQTAVAALGYDVVRLAGPDRYTTSVAIADFMTTSNGTTVIPQRIMVATGVNFADALSAGAAAGGSPVVLTADTAMPAATAGFLKRFSFDGGTSSVPLYAIGGQANTALQSIGFGTASHQYTDIHGADRYATSSLVARTFFDGPTRVGFATGVSWADALSGGALMGGLYAPLILVNPTTGPDAATTTWLQHTGPQLQTALIFGGNAAVTPAVDRAVGTAISGAAGYDQATNPQDITY